MAVTQLVRSTQIKPGTAYRVVVNDSTGKLAEAALTASNVLVSDANGLPTASGTSTTTLGYLDVGSSLTTLLSGKEPTLSKGNLTEATSNILTISSGTGAVIGSGTSIQVKQAATAQSGYLSSTDWNTFNGKQAALGFTPEDVSNKSTNTSLGTSDTLYPSQKAVKTYVDAVAQGLNIHASCHLATTAQLTVTVSGSGVGKTLTYDAYGPQSIDSHALVLTDRVLVKNQTTSSNVDNGIYSVTTLGVTGVAASFDGIINVQGGETDTLTVSCDTTGTAGNKIITGTGTDTCATLIGAGYTITAGGAVILKSGDEVSIVGGINQVRCILTRATDFDGTPSGEVATGDFTFIQTGTTLGGSGWVVTSGAGTIVVDTDAIVWSQFSAGGSYTAGNGIDIAGTVISLAPLLDGKIIVGNVSNVATNVAMSGEATIINTGAVTLSNAAVIGKTLTAFSSGAGAVTSSDSILAAIQHLDGNVVGTVAVANAALPSASFTDAAVVGKLLTGYSSTTGTITSSSSIVGAISILNGNDGLRVLKSGDTMTGALKIDPATNQLEFGGLLTAKKVVINSTAGSSDWTVTLAPTGNCNFLLSGQASIVTGDISASAGITLSQLAATTPGYMVVGTTGTGVLTGVAMSADATLAYTGALTIASSAITFAKTNQVILEKVNETPTGTLRIFSVDNALVSGSEMVFVNGMVQQKGSGNDYTVTKTTTPAEITFETGNAPPTGSEVLVTYWKL